MFLIFINKLASVVESYGVIIKLYADADVKLYMQIIIYNTIQYIYFRQQGP